MSKRARRTVRFERLISAVCTPIFVLTARREIAFFNSGCEQLTGWSLVDVVGHVCDYSNAGERHSVEALASSLCPPPEVYVGQEASVLAHIACRSGEPVSRMLHFFPLKDASGKVLSVLGVTVPLSQLQSIAESTPARQLHLEVSTLRTQLEQRFGISSLICRSGAMERVLRQIRLASSSPFVFLHGEAGSGKEHVARVIHFQSSAGQSAFVPLDCRRTSALELKHVLRRVLASVQDVRNEAASDPMPLRPGTVYLKHVESLPRDLQQMLIEFERSSSAEAGGTKWIAASETDLQTPLKADVYRPDFYFQFSTLVIELPPLRLRRDDLPPLAQALLEERNRNGHKQLGGFSDEVWERFREYNWRGNVDELAAVIEEAWTASSDSLIQCADLPFRFRTGLDAQAVGPIVQSKLTPLEPLLARVEQEQIELALAQSRHNKSKAAALLGITRARLYRRMNVLGIEDREETG